MFILILLDPHVCLKTVTTMFRKGNLKSCCIRLMKDTFVFSLSSDRFEIFTYVRYKRIRPSFVEIRYDLCRLILYLICPFSERIMSSKLSHDS